MDPGIPAWPPESPNRKPPLAARAVDVTDPLSSLPRRTAPVALLPQSSVLSVSSIFASIKPRWPNWRPLPAPRLWTDFLCQTRRPACWGNVTANLIGCRAVHLLLARRQTSERNSPAQPTTNEQKIDIVEAFLTTMAGTVASSGVLRRRPSRRRLPGNSGGVVANAIVHCDFLCGDSVKKKSQISTRQAFSQTTRKMKTAVPYSMLGFRRRQRPAKVTSDSEKPTRDWVSSTSDPTNQRPTMHRWLFEVDGGHGPTQWTRRRVEGTRPSRIDPVVAPNTARVSEKVTQKKGYSDGSAAAVIYQTSRRNGKFVHHRTSPACRGLGAADNVTSIESGGDRKKLDTTRLEVKKDGTRVVPGSGAHFGVQWLSGGVVSVAATERGPSLLGYDTMMLRPSGGAWGMKRKQWSVARMRKNASYSGYEGFNLEDPNNRHFQRAKAIADRESQKLANINAETQRKINSAGSLPAQDELSIRNLSLKEIKSELRTANVDTSSFIEKSDYIAALAKSRLLSGGFSVEQIHKLNSNATLYELFPGSDHQVVGDRLDVNGPFFQKWAEGIARFYVGTDTATIRISPTDMEAGIYHRKVVRSKWTRYEDAGSDGYPGNNGGFFASVIDTKQPGSQWTLSGKLHTIDRSSAGIPHLTTGLAYLFISRSDLVVLSSTTRRRRIKCTHQCEIK
ncbi:hypothetical protein THAOC_01845 [Thalassiosira oceanica]|uniref:Uncharacterized protein n=1 Tax=Thalassiosira oceanica TaxID=159749 RepID=K0TG77_THAOC|nr:hypothetical protein THAOC_01845 [Thalassiosira oceanica]|eukprot:EJK76395.1 hypothetical protein THAOC_01845 [Thalassiosira oceanica]